MTNIKNNPKVYFEQQRLKFTKSLHDVKHKIKRISLLRIIVFLITTIGIYLSVANGHDILAIAFTLGIGLFIYLVKIHAGLEKDRLWNETLVTINKNELRILDGDTIDMDAGSEFLHPSHPYNEDLDVFGDRSLFQLINRTATTTGRSTLAHKLNNLITNINSLVDRQLAISCLRDKADWRQNFLAIGKIFEEKKDDLSGLLTWSQTSDVRFNTMFYRIMLIVNPIIGFGVLTLIELEIFTISTFLIFLLLPVALVGTKLGLLNKIHAQLSKKSGLLSKYAKLFRLIAFEEFNSKLLLKIKENISGEHSAHRAIKSLAKISKSMDYRLNMLVGVFLNVFFLWDIRQAIKIEKWKNRYTTYMENWFDQLSTMDELNSFAGFAFNFPNSTFPEFSTKDFKIRATNVTHPLISQKECIGNDITIDGWKQFQIITGANMAGKSTYLRTVGVNMVLALTGSPVLADSFIMKPVGIFTGIKTTDSIQNGESYFFAELKKLKELINKLEDGQQLFVILAEVLKGTNSADKQKGSMALITHLIKLSSSGMIATHDLALGSLANNFPDNVTNKRFEVEIANKELVFDYKLKNGISQNLNATFLMKKMGITI
jgi:DNA mismatch repair ATPase MutS